MAVVCLLLPWAGLALIGAGLWRFTQSETGWLWLMAGGLFLIVIDVIVDFAWADPAVSRSDTPHLNARAAQIVGRIVVLVEPIEAGLGKIRCDDTLWQVEGPDLPAGARVRVTGAKGMRLAVEPLH